MGLFEIARLLLSLLPLVIDAVKAVEVAIPAANSGAQKLATVLSTVQAAASLAPAVVSSGAAVQASVKSGDVPGLSLAITHMVGNVVSIFNAAGVFQKSAAVQAVTASGLALPAPVDASAALVSVGG